MAIPRLPKPQSGGLGGKPPGRAGSGAPRPFKAGKKATNIAGKAVSKIPFVGRPLSGALSLGKGAAKAASGAAGLASTAADSPGEAGQSAAAGASRLAGRAGKRASKSALRMSKRAGKALAKKGIKALAKGAKALASIPVVGWVILGVILVVIFLFFILLAISGQTFLASFGDQQTDVAVVSDDGSEAAGAEQVFFQTQIPHHNTSNQMEASARATGANTQNREQGFTEIGSDRASAAPSFPAGRVEIAAPGLSEPDVVSAGEILLAAVPDDQHGLADLVEWMLPQWVAPYPLMVAEADGVEIEEGEWPEGSGNVRQIVSCAWPDHHWAGEPPYEESPGVAAQPDDVTIRGPWTRDRQHVCHLLAAANVMWDAWGEVFGDQGFIGSRIDPSNTGPVPREEVPRLDLTAVRRLWLTDPPSPDERNEYASGLASLVGNVDNDPDRLWVWLSFAYFFNSAEAPVSSQYDCGIAISDAAYGWEHMAEYAESGGHMQSAEGLPLPEDFFASYEAGDLLVPWPCPREPRAALHASARGLWAPVAWSQDLADFGPDGTRLVNGLGVSAAVLGTMRSRGMNVDLAQEHGRKPEDAHDLYDEFIGDLPDDFNINWLIPLSEWGLPARQPSDAFENWCAPDTRWVSETAQEHESETDHEMHPKGALIQEFADDVAEARRLSSEAGTLLATATGIRSAISSAISAALARLAEATEDDLGTSAIAAEIAALERELVHAGEMVAAMREVVVYWDHAIEQADRRPENLDNGPQWQYGCKHGTFDDALGSLGAKRGDLLPDEGNIFNVLYTTGGYGRALSSYGDHVNGRNSPLENAIRVAHHAGLLPELKRRVDPSDQTVKPMVSASCSEEDWLARRCIMNRTIQQGTEFIVMPDEWTRPRLPLRCPPIYLDSNDLMESRLGDVSPYWDNAEEGAMVSVAPFTSFHPCMLPDVGTASWLVEAVGIKIAGHSFRSWAGSQALMEQSPLGAQGLVAPPGQSRHNYGLALDMTWQTPACWPPPGRFDEPCPPASAGSSTTSELCGLESRNGADGVYVNFTTVANAGDGRHADVSDVIMATNWCWQFLDWATYRLSGFGERLRTGQVAAEGMPWRYPLVGLLPLSIEVWHWSYDGR